MPSERLRQRLDKQPERIGDDRREADHNPEEPGQNNLPAGMAPSGFVAICYRNAIDGGLPLALLADSEGNLQRELRETRRRGRKNPSEVCGGDIRNRYAEIRMIGDIKKLRAELDSDALCDVERF